MTFQTVKRGKGDYQFLIVPNGSNVNICDSDGNNYGSYYDFKSFEAFAERNGGFDAIKLGMATVSIHPVSITR